MKISAKPLHKACPKANITADIGPHRAHYKRFGSLDELLFRRLTSNTLDAWRIFLRQLEKINNKLPKGQKCTLMIAASNVTIRDAYCLCQMKNCS